MTSKDLESSAPLDDVDFTSGFETQYEQEYRPLKHKVIVPRSQDPKTLWYRDLKTVLMILFIVAVLVFGTVLLMDLFSPLFGFVITAIYVILAFIMIFIEVLSKHVR